MTRKPKTPLLDKVKVPADLRRLPESDLPQLAEELRAELIDAVSVTGGHPAPGSASSPSRCITSSTRRMIA